MNRNISLYHIHSCKWIQIINISTTYQGLTFQDTFKCKTIARHDDLLPDGTMLSLEGNWASLRRAVQESNSAGSFLRMFCNEQLTSTNNEQSHHYLVIRSVVPSSNGQFDGHI